MGTSWRTFRQNMPTWITPFVLRYAEVLRSSYQKRENSLRIFAKVLTRHQFTRHQASVQIRHEVDTNVHPSVHLPLRRIAFWQRNKFSDKSKKCWKAESERHVKILIGLSTWCSLCKKAKRYSFASITCRSMIRLWRIHTRYRASKIVWRYS